MQKADTDKILHGTGLGVLDMAGKEDNRGPLNTRCIVPPYSTMNTREGFWQDRKRAWNRLGIASEIGRGNNLTFNIPMFLSDGSPGRMASGGRADGGTSIFDPVLCEIAYTWWSAPGQIILDPFAGGSVRGIVAAVLGRKYMGFELSAEQVAANREQAMAINNTNPGLLGYRPKWTQGDSGATIPAWDGEADFLFSCPPYGNLEVYSDDPLDISNRTHEEFLVAYREIIKAGFDKLKPNRFAAFVVANYRPKNGKGRMVDFVGDTIDAFEDAGATFWNDIIIINAVGTGALRGNGNFVRGHRKVVKMHQNLLVFVKGDAALAAAELPTLLNQDADQ